MKKTISIRKLKSLIKQSEGDFDFFIFLLKEATK